ncbi:MAG: type II toxin-antitoxin system RelE/ParE family toxin [Erysipelotrichaceae bacterium]|nr:type II toxin-antitoxin system RelE/ParE family toxin [Erysipelotrichaceae bacterium]
MAYTIIVSKAAEDMLLQHIAFLARISKEAARKEKEKLITAIRGLAEDPLIYPFLDEEYLPRNKYHKRLADKRYLILYQVKDETVYVDFILDVRRDCSWLVH